MKRTFLFLLGLALLWGGYQYQQAPLFWKRYFYTLSSAGKGASSKVFDYTEAVMGGELAELPVAAEPSIEPATLQAMADYAAEFDSFALIVLHRGEVQLEWYRQDYQRASLTQSQSMHKSLQALLVGIAIDEGLINSTDEPIGKYLEELKGSERGNASIRNYLTMASGLRPFEGGFSPFGEAFRGLYASDLDNATLAIEKIAAAGEAFEYHDANSQLLGMMLSRVFQGSYADYLQEKLWLPLGAGPAKVWLDNAGGVAHHNCCLLARAMDWARVGLLMQNQGLINGRQVVSAEWIQQQTQAGLSPHYGFQTWLANNAEPNPRSGGGGYRRSEPFLAEDLYYFSGYGAQRVYISPSRELVIVRLGPAAGYFPKIAETWDNSFLFNTAVRGLKN